MGDILISVGFGKFFKFYLFNLFFVYFVFKLKYMDLDIGLFIKIF